MQIKCKSLSKDNFIHDKFSYEKENINPQLDINDIPPKTKSLLLIIEDPDAPKEPFIHWILFNIAKDIKTIDENSAPGNQGRNDFGNNKYDGPCPPSGTHKYIFKLYALNCLLDLKTGVSKQLLSKTLKDTMIIEETDCFGYYKK